MRASTAAAVAAALALSAAPFACAPSAENLGAVELRPAEVALPPGARLRLLDAVELRDGRPEFGGFSALEVSADGTRFVMLDDRGFVLEGRLERVGDRLRGVEAEGLRSLRRRGERPAYAFQDAEGLAIPAPDLDGPRFVGFERAHRLARFADGRADEAALPPFGGMEDWNGNEGLEALAIAPDGRLLAIRERAEEGEGPAIPAWWLGPDGAGPARPTSLTAPEGMSITGADFGPDGRLYALARRFDWLSGFSFAVLRYELEGDALTGGEELLRLVPSAGADNAEGIAAWRDAEGRVRLLVVTDDNFNLLQRTLLYDFAVTD